MNGFYKSFEDRFRGSRELITSRLRVYLPLVEEILNIQPDFQALDLGCGRGEWLELLSEMNLACQGCDLDEGMLLEAQNRGLDALKGDALEILGRMGDNSLSVVSAFHLVEHISFKECLLLIHHAYRVLRPGGVVILETPNPESILAHAMFHTDPTHQNPIPPQLLQFMVEYSGFDRVEIWRLQEDPTIHDRTLGIFDVMHGVSPDYSIVGLKALKTAEASTHLESVLSEKRGLSLSSAARRYDEQIAALKKEVATLEHELQEIRRSAERQSKYIHDLEASKAEKNFHPLKSFFKWR